MSKRAYKISIWCNGDELTEAQLSMALEQGELWDTARDVQYMIEEVTTS